MLDSTARRFLKYIVKATPCMDDDLFTFDYVGAKLGLSKDEVFDCLDYLESLDYVHCVYVDNETLQLKHSLWGFRPSHKGRHYIEFYILDCIETVFKSILLPILVSLITALIVT